MWPPSPPYTILQSPMRALKVKELIIFGEGGYLQTPLAYHHIVVTLAMPPNYFTGCPLNSTQPPMSVLTYNC